MTFFLARYHSSITPKAVWASLAAWEMRFDLPPVFCPTPILAGRQIEQWALYFAREIVLSANALLRATTNVNGEEAG
jgi:hypothetical protein